MFLCKFWHLCVNMFNLTILYLEPSQRWPPLVKRSLSSWTFPLVTAIRFCHNFVSSAFGYKTILFRHSLTWWRVRSWNSELSVTRALLDSVIHLCKCVIHLTCNVEIGWDGPALLWLLVTVCCWTDRCCKVLPLWSSHGTVKMRCNSPTIPKRNKWKSRKRV